MELLAILRLLWARWILVVVGAVVAVAVALAVMHTLSAPPRATWLAATRVLVDTSDSELVHAAPKSAETLPMRAMIGSNVLATSAVKAQVAKRAGVPASQLEILGPAARADPPVSDELVTQDVPFSGVTRSPYVLSLYADGLSPIVSIEANAFDRRRALTLAAAATGVLRSALLSPRDPSRGFVVKTVTSPRATELAHGSRRGVLAAAGALAVFAIWCGAIVLLSGIVARTRTPRTAC